MAEERRRREEEEEKVNDMEERKKWAIRRETDHLLENPQDAILEEVADAKVIPNSKPSSEP